MLHTVQDGHICFRASLCNACSPMACWFFFIWGRYAICCCIDKDDWLGVGGKLSSRDWVLQNLRLWSIFLRRFFSKMTIRPWDMVPRCSYRITHYSHGDLQSNFRYTWNCPYSGLVAYFWLFLLQFHIVYFIHLYLTFLKRALPRSILYVILLWHLWLVLLYISLLGMRFRNVSPNVVLFIDRWSLVYTSSCYC